MAARSWVGLHGVEDEMPGAEAVGKAVVRGYVTVEIGPVGDHYVERTPRGGVEKLAKEDFDFVCVAAYGVQFFKLIHGQEQAQAFVPASEFAGVVAEGDFA